MVDRLSPAIPGRTAGGRSAEPPGDHDDGYDGPAEVLVTGLRLTVRVQLRGCFHPVLGRYRWYGRLAPHEELSRVLGDGGRAVVVRTPEGAAPARIGDPDLWGRLRVEGTGTPPFRIHDDLGEG